MPRPMTPLLLALMLPLIAGCTYRATPAEVTLSEIPSLDDRIVPGRWAMYSDGGGFNRLAYLYDLTAFGCGRIRVPVQGAVPFETSVYSALDQVFDTLEQVPTPLTPHDIGSQGYDGYIEVRSRAFNPSVAPYYRWQARYLRGQAEMSANVRVFDSHGGLRVGTAFGGAGEVTNDAWRTCTEVDEAIAAATTEAMEEMLMWMSSRLAQDGKVRQIAGQLGVGTPPDFE